MIILYYGGFKIGILSEADYIVDIGSHVGSDSGHLVFEGSIDNFLKSNNSITAQCLRDNKKKFKIKL
ncbi:hypothetical protein [uncultured Clostridium sp.]|uniref:hypothetical protein n=1 Tax=uncultured Clostridium sp. TaxID=59620 RepID=UPI0028E1ADBD|nr:hypothetical protein [uncultured Clostridium sp.]